MPRGSMTILDILIQVLIAAFGGLIILWAAGSFAEIRISQYLYQALAFVNRLIASEQTFNPRVLPEVVVTEGSYAGRKAVVRLNVLSPRFLKYRIHVHLLVQPRLPVRAYTEDPLAYRHPSRTIVWPCSLTSPPPYNDVMLVFKELTVEAEALEMEGGR